MSKLQKAVKAETFDTNLKNTNGISAAESQKIIGS